MFDKTPFALLAAILLSTALEARPGEVLNEEGRKITNRAAAGKKIDQFLG